VCSLAEQPVLSLEELISLELPHVILCECLVLCSCGQQALVSQLSSQWGLQNATVLVT
jgi:hypothetical protein